MRKEKTYTLKFGIRMRSHVKDPQLDTMNKMAVRRAHDAERGPLDLFKVMKRGHSYRVVYDYSGETIRVLSTKQKCVRRVHGDKIPKKVCRPLYIPRVRWYSPGTLPGAHKSLYSSSSGSSNGTNVFGEPGIVRIHHKHSFQIPRINILDCERSMYEAFGVRVFKSGEPLPRLNTDVFMVSYEISAHFATQYVHHSRGPGIFLEQHSFAHYFMPLSRVSHGPVVIGRFKNGKDSSRGMYVIGVEVPVGHVLYIPPHVIHNDWYFVGKVATTVTTADSDTVFLRGAHGKRIAMSFLTDPAGTAAK